MARRAFAVPVTAVAVFMLVLAVAGPAHATEPDTAPPTIPTGIEATNVTESSLTLSWTPSTDDVGVAGYHLQWVLGDVLSGRRTARTSITLTGLSKWNTYQFWVYAFDAAGNRSADSDTFWFTMPAGDTTRPSAPGPLTASEVTDTAATLTWGASVDNGGIRAYEIFRLVGDTGALIATVPTQSGSSVRWRLTNLTPATAYTLAVRARDNAGNTSSFTSPYTLTTLACPEFQVGG